ncbi:MAG: hypothetical protein A3I66_15810 [Burkholderiales bacterium RIFCSPLOWO2_02_FULL_57_36]|nr:MAG: hypothetical protein A3I66_15810 [Burkholderiales bacterium RIFCSPLOWO2_02_FULL_57_36]
MKSFAHAGPDINEPDKPLISRILPDILAFAIGLAAAYFLKWDIKDLVWSLWLCSLVLGYLTLLGALAGGAYIGVHAITHKDFKKSMRMTAILMGLGLGAFFLGFFSLHFGAFHAGHSVFLQQFFPVEGMPKDGFGDAFMNPPLLWILVFKHLMAPYGLFLIPAIIAERQHVFMPLIKAVKAVRTDTAPDFRLSGRTEGQNGKKSHPAGDAMSRPYINVVRMHLLIFFFAFAHILKLDSFLVYAVVSFVYFFPWSEFKKRRASNKPVDATA